MQPQVISTGAAHLLVALRNRSTVGKVQPNADLLLQLLKKVNGEGCYVFCVDPIDVSAKAHARFFDPTVGISEDPATGTAAGPLGCYLRSQNLVADGKEFIVE